MGGCTRLLPDQNLDQRYSMCNLAPLGRSIHVLHVLNFATAGRIHDLTSELDFDVTGRFISSECAWQHLGQERCECTRVIDREAREVRDRSSLASCRFQGAEDCFAELDLLSC